MDNIKKYFTWAIIIILVIVILLERACTSSNLPITKNEPVVVTKIDTIWKTKIDTIVKTVTQTKTIHSKIPDSPRYQPSSDIDTCQNRFNKLLKDYLTKRVYQDTLDLGKLGKIYVTDTVFTNKLGKRIKTLDVKTPTVFVTKTITKEKDPVNQLYIGGNLFGQLNKIQALTPGLIYKTKKDHVYQVNIGINTDGSITYGVGVYYKIKFHK